MMMPSEKTSHLVVGSDPLMNSGAMYPGVPQMNGLSTALSWLRLSEQPKSATLQLDFFET